MSRNGTGYQSLRNLTKLEHLYIEINAITIFKYPSVKSIPDQTRELFENLTYCAGRLKSVSIHLYGESNLQDCRQEITGFFEACADSLTDLTFKITFDLYALPGNMDIFYTSIAKLKQLTRLAMIYEGFPNDRFKVHSVHLKNLLCTNIKELCISAEGVSSELNTVNLTKIKDLQRLSLDCYSLVPSSGLIKNRASFQSSLKFLEISLNRLSKESWYKLLNTIDFLNALKELKIKIEILSMPQRLALEDLKLWIKNHKNLRLIVFSQEQDPLVVDVFIKDALLYSERDVDGFLARGLECVPKKRCHRKYFI